MTALTKIMPGVYDYTSEPGNVWEIRKDECRDRNWFAFPPEGHDAKGVNAESLRSVKVEIERSERIAARKRG